MFVDICTDIKITRQLLIKVCSIWIDTDV